MNLFGQCFKELTAAQVKAYKVSSRVVRMVSKLISSNIAWYSRYEIIHKTLVMSATADDIAQISDQMIRQRACDFLGEDAAKTVYRTDTETMGKYLLDLGIVIKHLLDAKSDQETVLLRRVFNEQYEVDKDGNVVLRDNARISSTSIQSPNDTDAAYPQQRWQESKRVLNQHYDVYGLICTGSSFMMRKCLSRQQNKSKIEWIFIRSCIRVYKSSYKDAKALQMTSSINLELTAESDSEIL